MSRSGAGDEWFVELVGYPDEKPKRERLKVARSKLYEVLKHYGYSAPKGFGKQWIKCPFHDDNHASAAVDWQTNYFTCFACEVKGTALDIVMLQEGLGLDDAAQRIEEF